MGMVNMGDTPERMPASEGWKPCGHFWEDVINWGDPEWREECLLCGEERPKEMDESRRGGWRGISAGVTTNADMVCLTLSDPDDPLKIIYRAMFSPDIARQLAFRLTTHALEIEDQ